MKRHFENIVIVLMVAAILGFVALAGSGALPIPRWLLAILVLVLFFGSVVLAIVGKSVLWPEPGSRMAGRSFGERLRSLYWKDERPIERNIVDSRLGNLEWDDEGHWKTVGLNLPLQIDGDWAAEHDAIRPAEILLNWAREIEAAPEVFRSGISALIEQQKYQYPEWDDNWTSEIDFVSLSLQDGDPVGALYYEGSEEPVVYLEFDRTLQGNLHIAY